MTNLFNKDNVISDIHWLKYKSGKRQWVQDNSEKYNLSN